MSRTQTYVEDRTVLLSLHSITPFFEDDVVKTLDLLSDLGISSLTLLVTPFYNMKRSNVFEKSEMFSEYLLSLKLELSLLGYSHSTKSGAPKEFEKLTMDQALTRMKRGMALFKTAFGKKPVGFIPPLWVAPPRVDRAARESGLTYCVRDITLKRLADSRTFSVAATIISQGTTALSTADAMLEMELGGPLQIGIHPLDHSMNNMLNILADLRDNLDYQFIGYMDYLQNSVT